ncbi:ATP-binding cassette domain-containing protein [Saccharibacter sp. 17.LH.SD]|uniref:ATP-binding cassette domain-containing protein n=1 Tax=Saccharibacter sp. 17.LH.SD TaxID=2689393 RepID=UPI001369F048|nr:ATP-binding cassette domain-containing protein [Saccharibacter sp. 17.LH.SD]MXV44751.1 ATP-binding cassette domain-containing protein [Saccharibacter sp. 17.LH.SD]
MTMINLHDLSLPVAPHHHVGTEQRVSLTLQRGALCWIVGSSGSGKTALLETLALQRPFKGVFRLFDQDITPRTSSRTLTSLRQRIGFLEENPLFCDTLTVCENIALPLEINGVKRSEYLRETSTILSWFQLDLYADRLPASLPLLVRWQLACTRTLIRRPPLLLIEASPLISLPDFRVRLFSVLNDLAQSGSTILLTTNDDSICSDPPASILHLPSNTPSKRDSERDTLSPNLSAPYSDQRREPRLS